jgi:hypothetical protein
MLKKKWAFTVLSGMLIFVLAVGAGTFALFSGTLSNANRFQAGTVQVDVNPEPMYYTADSHPGHSYPYNIETGLQFGGEALGGWAPGDEVPREMAISNSGSLDVIITGVHAEINLEPTPGGVAGLDQHDPRYQQFMDKINVVITDRTRDLLLYDGSLRGLLDGASGGDGGKAFNASEKFVIAAADDPRMIDFLVRMDKSADNDLQGVTWVFDFIFTAEQQRNNPDQPSANKSITGSVFESITHDAIAGALVDFGNGYFTTTNEDGVYLLEIPAGTYNASISAAGFQSKTVENIAILDPLTHHDFYLDRMVLAGTASGLITHALDGTGVSGLTIKFRSGHNTQSGDVIGSTTTGANGAYSISLPAGSYTGEIIDSHGLYITSYFNIVTVSGVDTPDQNASVSPLLGEGDWRIVLNWGRSPADLDAHLTGPKGNNGSDRFHVYYDNRSYYNPNGFFNRVLRAHLDRDDTNGYGPETVTITNQFQGVYRYSVHDYTNRNSNNSNALANSAATVTVFKGNHQIASFSVPSQKGTLWTVFEINGETITPKNMMSYVLNPNNPGPFSQNGESDLPATDAEIIARDVFTNPKDE